MTAVGSAAQEYLAVRRAVGYKLGSEGVTLDRFVAFLDARAETIVTVALALEWAAGAPRGGVADRLRVVRGFARYLQAIDPAHEVPPVGLVPVRRHRPVPRLYAADEIVAMTTAARTLKPRLRAATTETVIGLLAVTGMRIGEVLRLDRADIDLDTAVLTIWFSKFNKSRHVPVSATTAAALARYDTLRRRLTRASSTGAFFVGADGGRLTYRAFTADFHAAVAAAGIATAARQPIHGFRHSFAVATLVGWYRDGADVQALLPRLSTYLGHVDPASTYWYLSATPELLALAAERLDAARGSRTP
jgi:integrase